MKFTYASYGEILDTLLVSNYNIVNYHNWEEYSRCAILRHDIDYDMKKAVEMARYEMEKGVNSTYFVLLTSEFYNVFALHTNQMLRKIQQYGHEIGLHFDEVRYGYLSIEEIRDKILFECKVLEQAIDSEVRTVSMHRPSKQMLEANLRIPGVENSYGEEYFKGFKYISDSRRNWREPVDEIIRSNRFNRIHILTHAFWYNEKEIDLRSSLLNFVNHGNIDRYAMLGENFTRLSEEVSIEEISGGNL